MNQHSIYALCEPGTLTVRYVGATKRTVKQRAQAHHDKAAYYPATPVEKWIAQLGKQPDCIELATCQPSLAREVEKAWILLFIDNGYDMLNIRDCDGRGKKSKRKPDRCSDPVYARDLMNRMIAEEAEMVAAGLPSPFGKRNRNTEAI